MRKLLYILGELQDSDLQWLLDAGTAKRVAAGEELIREGGTVRDLFIVVDGELSVMKGESEVARLEVGDVVGDISLVDSRPATATVTAGEDTVVQVIPQSDVRSKLKADAAFAARFYRALCIFLADRLSRAGPPVDEADQEEISPEALGGAALAGARFDWFLKHCKRP